MNPPEVALVALVGVLCLVNLLLVTAVIRRLRMHEERLGKLQAPFDLFGSGLDVGVPVPDFAVVSIGGEPVSTASLAGPGPSAIAFVSAACDACEGKLDDFLALAGRGEDTCFAVVADDPAGTSELARRAAQAVGVTVVTEADSGTMTSAFQVRGFPMFFRLRDGRVVTKAATPRALSSEPAMRGGA